MLESIPGEFSGTIKRVYFYIYTITFVHQWGSTGYFHKRNGVTWRISGRSYREISEEKYIYKELLNQDFRKQNTVSNFRSNP